MRDVLEANERRRLEVIEYLYTSNRWLTLREIAQNIASSERILKQDMTLLREQFSREVLQTSHRGIRLVLPSNKDIDDIYRHILKNSLAFNFIEQLIYDETKTVAKLAEELFVSQSTLTRLIKKINVSLKKSYCVQVQTKPCKMISESEENIRYFYISYFSERYSNFDWPYKTIDQSFFEQLLLFLANALDFPLDFADFKRLKNWTAIPYLRIQQGHYVTIKSDRYSNMVPDFTNFQHLARAIKKRTGDTLNVAFIEQLFSIFINNDFALSYDFLIEAAKNDPVINEKVSYHATLLDYLSDQVQISIPNRNHLIKEMYNISHFAFKTKQGDYPLPFILFDPKKQFIQSMEELFPHFITAAFTTLDMYEQKMHETYSESARYEIIYTLLIHWDHLLPDLYNQKGKFHLLIISDLDFEHARMIQYLLHHYFKQEITTEIYMKPTVSIEQIKKQPHDFLVTTFSLETENLALAENSICIQNIPTKQNISSIRQAIEEHYKLRETALKFL
ncbi:helix-turn-helix domain-containing protein [Carnobacterium pleistocenium]|uniref:helix-turn-helix domain-containing protein n=1 Tax=Carnobacterium pleistocenium TaxID=181073 RepID=UPI00055138D3|nr:helix-turn-helix domain-containing protein [Carnobacterium pleistocenium]